MKIAVRPATRRDEWSVYRLVGEPLRKLALAQI
jgi:hypothetical protein